MNSKSLCFKRCLLALTLLCIHTLIFAQTWLELREQNANFYDIKAAFNRQYGARLNEMNRELRREVHQTGVRSSKYERKMEGMIQYMRWAHFVEPRVKESNGDLGSLSRNMVQALADQNRYAATARKLVYHRSHQ